MSVSFAGRAAPVHPQLADSPMLGRGQRGPSQADNGSSPARTSDLPAVLSCIVPEHELPRIIFFLLLLRPHQAPYDARREGIRENHPNDHVKWSIPARERNSGFSVIVPSDGTKTANVGPQTRYAADFRAALGRAAACQYLPTWAVGTQNTMAQREITRRSDSLVEWPGELFCTDS